MQPEDQALATRLERRSTPRNVSHCGAVLQETLANVAALSELLERVDQHTTCNQGLQDFTPILQFV